MRVDLIFDIECPNAEEARKLIQRALTMSGRLAVWREWPRQSPRTPAAMRRYGSPTVLVNGVDVDGDPAVGMPSIAARCRLYEHADRLRGVPTLAAIANALQDVTWRQQNGQAKQGRRPK